MAGLDLAQGRDAARAPYEWTGEHVGARRRLSRRRTTPRFHVVAYDYGIKHNILRMLAERGCRVTVVPAQTPATRRARAASPTASSCPTAPATRSPATTRSRRSARSSTRGMPTFGICLGHQLLGARRRARRTLKMKFGHHGANHPVQDRDTGQVLITSQNHGFAVDPTTLPANAARRRTSRCSTARCRASRAPTSRRSASRATPRRAPGRTTSAICSTASSQLMDRAQRRRSTACRSAPTSRSS